MRTRFFKWSCALFVTVLICGFLILSYALSVQLARVMSMIVAGLVVGLIFTITAWPILRSEMNYLQQRNLLMPLYVILSVTIFWLAAVYGGGSIFRVHNLKDISPFSLIFSGGIFGLMMGAGALFDIALLNSTAISKLALVGSLLLFSIMIFWYSFTDGSLFVVSTIIARIVFSVSMNRVYVREIADNLGILRVFVLSLTFIVLPWTAFLSK